MPFITDDDQPSTVDFIAVIIAAILAAIVLIGLFK